ncbi:flavodoxin family protein [Monashia sp. NPDC004114]
MKVLIVHESLFGNTRQVAEAVAEGLRKARPPGDEVSVTLATTDEAPATIPADVSLLLVGGPTHALSMTRQGTREDAVTKGAPAQPRLGIREWIEAAAPRSDLPVVTFDTRVHVRLMPGSAAASAAKSLRHHGFREADRGETFWVEGTEGPLSPGELERAVVWGAALATAHSPVPVE